MSKSFINRFAAWNNEATRPRFGISPVALQGDPVHVSSDKTRKPVDATLSPMSTKSYLNYESPAILFRRQNVNDFAGGVKASVLKTDY